METENSLSVIISVIFNSLSLSTFGGSWESSGVMRNVKSTVTGTLKSTEDSGTSGGSLETNIQEALEWAFLTLEF